MSDIEQQVELSENEIIEIRRNKLAELRKTGMAFPNQFRRDSLAGELINNFDCARLLKMKLRLESTIKSLLPERVIIVGENAPYRNANTTNVVIKKSKSDSLVSAFDLKGIAVSTGSACSTGASVPSRILLEMGLSEEFAKQALRFSLPPNITDQEIEGTEKVMNVIFSSLFQAP